MTEEQLHLLFEENPDCGELAWTGPCRSCRKETEVSVSLSDEGFIVKGGAVLTDRDGSRYIKCDSCSAQTEFNNRKMSDTVSI